MIEEQQRITIAEACGLRVEVAETGGYYVVVHRNGLHPNGYEKSAHYIAKESAIRKLPDYLNDLNAMHEAENVLSEYQLVIYTSRLFELCDDWRNATHATSAQRAEAFLRTVGRWEES